MIDLVHLPEGMLFAGRYRIKQLVRAGGMGAVYDAMDSEERTGRRVALKLMRPEIVADKDARARFQREARVTTQIESSNVVYVLDAGVDEQHGVPFIVMEFLVGIELGDLLKQRGKLPAGEVVSMLVQVARALDKAHSKHIIHRDLKPENLYLVIREDEPPTVKILDFGIAKVLENADTSSTRAAGTPLYMAPEQTQRSSHIGPATDVWALGLMTYTMLVGRPYWESVDDNGQVNLNHLFREVLVTALEPPTQRARRYGVHLPPAFDGWFAQCVNRDPQLRIQRASQAIAQLAAALGEPLDGRVSAPTPQKLDATVPFAGMLPGQSAAVPVYGAISGEHRAPSVEQPAYRPSYPQPQPPMGLAGTVMAAPQPMQPGYASPQQFQPPPQQYQQQQYQQQQHQQQPQQQASLSGTVMAPNATPPNVYVPQAQPQLPYGQGTTPGVAHVTIPTHGGEAPSTERRASPPMWIAGAVLSLFLVSGLTWWLWPSAPPQPPPNANLFGEDNDDPSASGSSTSKKTPTQKPLADVVAATNPFVDVDGLAVQEHEVSQEEYAAFLASRPDSERGALRPFGWPSDAAPDAHKPVTNVTWDRADKFCRAISARLPSNENFTKALGGNGFPSSSSGMGYEESTPADVESHPSDRNSHGVADLAGNVQEWTSSTMNDGSSMAIRGGSVSMAPSDGLSRTFTAAAGKPKESPEFPESLVAGPLLGFRCVK